MQSQYDLQTQLHYTVKAFKKINNSSMENPHPCNFEDAYMNFLIDKLSERFQGNTIKIHIIANCLGCYDAADYYLNTQERV